MTRSQAAYRRLARRYHPDIAGETATKRMMQINAAFDRVRDPVRRAEYDVELDEIDPIRAAKARRRPQHHDPSSPTEAEDAQRKATAVPAVRPPVQRDGTGAAGRPPGRPSGSVLDFGRHVGWSIGEIARVDPGLPRLAGGPRRRASRTSTRSTRSCAGRASGPTTDPATAKAASRARFGR